MRSYISAILGVTVCAVALAGCSPSVGELDAKERADVRMRKARVRESEGDKDTAMQLYLEVLAGNPRVARAHLDLALLLQDHKKDFVAAIYHYRRYLELRPETEKRRMLEDRIRVAKQLFAAETRPRGRVGKATETDRDAAMEARVTIENLRAKNQAIERDMTDLKKELERLRSRRASIRTYRVKKNDSLSNIAVKMYKDASRWQEIRNANQDILGDNDTVRTGQILIIP